MRHGYKWLIGVLVVVALAALVLIAPGKEGVLAQGDTIYVDADADGANNGDSWTDAYTDLQLALNEAGEEDQIWVAAGTYTPTAEHGGSGDRYKSFQMKNGVAIYGGFDPTVGHTEWEDRDWVAHPTILSGDLNGDDGPDFANNDENSYHVFYHDVLFLDHTAVLDGFTVSGGNSGHGHGGGMYNQQSSPTLINCTFAGNSATYGGGMANRESSSPTLANCTFEGNLAGQGGGMYNIDQSSPTLTNCTFGHNFAYVDGGGMYNYDSSSPALINCILWGDDAPEISNVGDSAPVVSYSDIQGGCDADPDNVCGEGNIDLDPLFVDPDNGDYHLGPGSPCIDAGANEAPDLPEYDFEGDTRIIDGDGDGDPVVDMGVDEALWHAVYLPLVLRGY